MPHGKNITLELSVSDACTLARILRLAVQESFFSDHEISKADELEQMLRFLVEDNMDDDDQPYKNCNKASPR